jgi:hypothetical protein
MNQPQKGRMRPNTFPTPNEHVDLAMEMLTPEEYKVLNFAIRHTWGWHVDQKAISITTFTHGYGPYRGVGMSRSTVLKCLSELSRLEFLVPMGKADADGQVWAVGLDPNIDALEQRYNEKKQKSQEIMSPIRAKKGKSKTAVYDTDRSMPQTDSGLSGRPTAVYGIDAIKDNPKDTSKDRKEKETTLSASAESAVSPVNDWSIADEADDAAMFVPKGKKQISAQAENGSKRLSKPTATTPPSPTPSPAAPVAVDDVETFSAKLDEAKGEKINPAVALGEAWGIAPANGDFSLYMRKAKELLKDIPIEEFKAYCDWRKKQAGDFASKLSIATLTGNGHVSAYLAQRNEAAEKARKQKEAEERLYAQNPHLIPPDAPVEYASPDEVRALILAAMKPATNTREEAS